MSRAALVACLAVLALAGCGGGSDDVPNDAIAVVDGEEVSKADYDDLLSRTKKSYETQQREFPGAGTKEFQALKTQLVGFLVQREELAQEADELGIEVTEEQVSKRLTRVKEQYFNGDEKKYKAQLRESGLTEDQVREDLRDQLVSEKIFARVTTDAKVTEQQIKQYYDANQAQYRQPDTREVQQIFVKTKAKADDLHAQLKAGADFAALARKHSEDTTTKDKGGKVTVSRGQTVAEFDQTAFSLKANELSAPVKSQFGYHLVQALGEVQKGVTTPLEDVRQAIRQQLLQTEKNEAMTDWVNDLKKDYEDKIDYAAGFAPPAAATTTAATTTTG